jgi:RNA recognition motif-containing protein
MNIYVGNLAFNVQEDELRDTFSQYGEVASVKIITDKFSGKSKGFGFVEMKNASDAKSAITGTNGKEVQGRAIVVNEARPQTNSGDRRPQRNNQRW